MESPRFPYFPKHANLFRQNFIINSTQIAKFSRKDDVLTHLSVRGYWWKCNFDFEIVRTVVHDYVATARLVKYLSINRRISQTYDQATKLLEFIPFVWAPVSIRYHPGEVAQSLNRFQKTEKSMLSNVWLWSNQCWMRLTFGSFCAFDIFCSSASFSLLSLNSNETDTSGDVFFGFNSFHTFSKLLNAGFNLIDFFPPLLRFCVPNSLFFACNAWTNAIVRFAPSVTVEWIPFRCLSIISLTSVNFSIISYFMLFSDRCISVTVCMPFGLSPTSANIWFFLLRNFSIDASFFKWKVFAWALALFNYVTPIDWNAGLPLLKSVSCPSGIRRNFSRSVRTP